MSTLVISNRVLIETTFCEGEGSPLNCIWQEFARTAIWPSNTPIFGRMGVLLIARRAFVNATRQSILGYLAHLDLDWGDGEDAEHLVDLLSEAFDPVQIVSWISFHNTRLGTTPLFLLEQGRSREVFIEARRLVAREAV